MGSLTSSKPDEEEVVISAADAREIARLLSLLQPPSERLINDNYLKGISRDTKPSRRSPRAKLIARAEAVFSERKRRTQYLSRAIFGEPAWDLLLCLYIIDGRRVTFGKLVNMIGEPMTTAVRWLDYLEKEHLVARRPDPADRRLVCIELLDRGRDILDSYFASCPDQNQAEG
jgi:DNA-binding MarR family transcriptional regulator